MPPKSKGKRGIAASSSFNRNTNATPPARAPPAPFALPPPQLTPLISKLDEKHIYITSIDTTSSDMKKKIFIIPVLTNVVLLALIAWRIWAIAPYYIRIASSLMGVVNDTTLDVSAMTRNELVYEGARRGLKFFGDLCIYVFLWPWPRSFFLGQSDANPVRWRLAVRFREREIAVRRSRRWDEGLGDVVSDGADGKGRRLFEGNVRGATSGMWMRERTAYLLLNKDWDLDWRLMILCTKMVDKKEMDMEDFRTTVLVHSKIFGWVTFEAQDASGSVREEDGRKKIMAFKDELTALGKENLFFRWIELIQYESSQPGGFGPERQAEATAKAKAMFESQGVDFEKFWSKIGGMEGMPGMDQS